MEINKKYLFYGFLTFLGVFIIIFSIKIMNSNYNVYDGNMDKVKRLKTLEDALEICWKEKITQEEFILCSILLHKKNKLNKEFLDENCECRCSEDSCSLNDFESTNCVQYKCGDFIVE